MAVRENARRAATCGGQFGSMSTRTAAKEADAARAAQVATTDEYGPLPTSWVCSAQTGLTFYYRQEPYSFTWTRPTSPAAGGFLLNAFDPRNAAAERRAGAVAAAAPAFNAPAFGARVYYCSCFRSARFSRRIRMNLNRRTAATPGLMRYSYLAALLGIPS